MPELTPAKLITWVAVAALVLASGSRLFGQAPAPVPASVTLEPSGSGRAERLYVDVAGAVRKPGLYRLPAGARVGEAVERAGGLRHAAPASVNLAAELEDGQQIVVVERGGGGAVPPPGVAPAPLGSSATTGAGTLSLATATSEQIDAAAEGIGPTLAARVVEYREQSGGFSSVEELREVPGIGEARFQALSAVLAP